MKTTLGIKCSRIWTMEYPYMPHVAWEEGNDGESNEKKMDNEMHTGIVMNCIGVATSLSSSQSRFTASTLDPDVYVLPTLGCSEA